MVWRWSRDHFAWFLVKGPGIDRRYHAAGDVDLPQLPTRRRSHPALRKGHPRRSQVTWVGVAV